MAFQRETNVANPRTGPNLRNLVYNSEKNPLLVTGAIPVKRRHVKTGLKRELTDTTTGEISGVATIHEIIEKDDAEFVKVFSDGVKAAF